MTTGGHGETGRVPVAVLISGRGSNMQALVEACEREGYPAEIVAVISNRPDAAGIAWADDRGIPTTVVDHTKFDSRQDFDDELHKILLASGANIIALAGFMRIMTDGAGAPVGRADDQYSPLPATIVRGATHPCQSAGGRRQTGRLHGPLRHARARFRPDRRPGRRAGAA